VIGCLIFFNGELDVAESFFRPLLEVGALHCSVGMRPYHTVNRQMNEDLGYGMRNSFHGVVFTTPLRMAFCQMI
jgi:hypothetical protein